VLSSADVAWQLMLKETGQMAVCFQNLTLGALSSHSMFYVLVIGVLLKKFSPFLNKPHVQEISPANHVA
jgi:hypothetical protein